MSSTTPETAAQATNTDPPDGVEQLADNDDEFHYRLTVKAEHALHTSLTAAEAALDSAIRARTKLIDELYHVEHAEGPADLGHFLNDAARAVRAALAVNPTRPGWSRPTGCEACGVPTRDLKANPTSDPREPYWICQNATGCAARRAQNDTE